MKRRKRRAPLHMVGGVLPTNVGLLELIRSNRESAWRPSVADLKKGFRGWHQRGYLPHFDAPHVTQMVTFMLADSFPVTRRSEWEIFLNESNQSVKRRKIEQWLDRGHGECWLRQSTVSGVVEQILLERNQRDFAIQSWVIMPNHVHILVNVWDLPLVHLINQWKGKAAREVNKVLGRSGRFWEADYFDTVIRDADHLQKAIDYIEANPVKALLVKSAREWPWSSARYRDEYERLPWQR